MKVLQIEGAFGLENLRFAERPDPQPGPGQLLLRMSAAALNYRDLLMVRGLYNPKQPLPLVPCSDGVGEVTAIGEGVTRCAVGDRVVNLQSALECSPCLNRTCRYRGEALQWRGEAVQPACYAHLSPERVRDEAMALLGRSKAGTS